MLVIYSLCMTPNTSKCSIISINLTGATQNAHQWNRPMMHLPLLSLLPKYVYHNHVGGPHRWENNSPLDEKFPEGKLSIFFKFKTIIIVLYESLSCVGHKWEMQYYICPKSCLVSLSWISSQFCIYFLTTHGFHVSFAAWFLLYENFRTEAKYSWYILCEDSFWDTGS